jgi:hypothetical protein
VVVAVTAVTAVVAVAAMAVVVVAAATDLAAAQVSRDDKNQDGGLLMSPPFFCQIGDGNVTRLC